MDLVMILIAVLTVLIVILFYRVLQLEKDVVALQNKTRYTL